MPRVAVLEVATPGIEDERAESLSATLVGIIANEVTALGYRVISSSDISAMLSLERQKDLLGCEEDTACLAEIGGALGVDLMVSASVGKLGETYSVSMAIVDIYHAEVKQRFSGNAGSEELLGATFARGVGVLFGKEVATAGMAMLVVRTDPPGGIVSLDGKEVGKAPLTLDEVPAGEHIVAARHGDASGKATVLLRPGAIERITVALQGAPPVQLKVISSPPDARVFLDDNEVGVTPVVLDDVSAGAHVLRVAAPGHRDAVTDVELSYEEYEAGGRVPLKVTLELEPHVESPIPFGIAVGPMVDARDLGAGMALHAELFAAPLAPLYELLDRFELGVGLTVPLAVAFSPRVWLLRSVIDAGVVGHFAVVRLARFDDWQASMGGGIVLGRGFVLPLGRGGVRLVASANWMPEISDHVPKAWTFPVALVAWWGL